MTEPPRRVHFATGRLLTAEDLAAEQTYHRQMRYLHNRLHGYGTVSGLDVALVDDHVRVSPGLAIDIMGRELVLAAALTVPVGSIRRSEFGVRDLVLTWDEDFEDPVPMADGELVATRVVERPRVLLAAPDEAPPEAVVLARLSRSGRGVTVDTSVRRRWGSTPVPRR